MATQISSEKTYTIKEFMALPEDGPRYELVKGKLAEMSPTGEEHGEITITLSILIGQHILQNKLGRIFGAETSFILDPVERTVRAPDFSFVAAGRLEKKGSGPIPVVPDLAVEVISPGDRLTQVRKKAQEYLQAGMRLVWLVNPRNKTVEVFWPGLEKHLILQAQDFLDGQDVVPGFRLAVQRIFE